MATKKESKNTSELTLLVDAPSLIYRALFSSPDSIKSPAGVQMNAAHGFLRMLGRLIVDQSPDYVGLAADFDWRPDWRVDLIPSYKAARAEPGSPQEKAEDLLAPQMPAIFHILDLLGLKMIGHDGSEAEDIIGTLAFRSEGRVAIFSGDRDLFQLVEDPNRFILYPVRGVSQLAIIDEKYIEDKYGIPGRAYGDFAIFRGDPSDGLPGVKGIGEKLATALIARYKNLDAVIEAAQESGAGVALGKVARDLDYVQRARKVVAIQTDLPIPETDLTLRPAASQDQALEEAEVYGIKNPVRDLIGALNHVAESRDLRG